METDLGCIFTSNAIARYVARCRADTLIYGRCFDDESKIDSWLEFCTHELEVPLMTWLYPVMGLMEDIPEATKAAQDDVKQAIASLEKQLRTSSYLTGNFLTLADITLVCALREGFERVFDAAFRKLCPKVCSWFESCCAMPQFKAVLGDVKLCALAEKPKPVQKPKQEAKAKQEPKQQPKAKATKAKPKAQAEEPSGNPPPAATPADGGGAAEDAVQAVGAEIRALKEKLKADGLNSKNINEHKEIKKLVGKLNELKSQVSEAGAAPVATPAPPQPTEDLEGQIKAVGEEVRVLKETLKGEGLSGKKLNEHPEVQKLVAQLQELKKRA